MQCPIPIFSNLISNRATIVRMSFTFSPSTIEGNSTLRLERNFCAFYFHVFFSPFDTLSTNQGLGL
jgi:hypothetical protein